MNIISESTFEKHKKLLMEHLKIENVDEGMFDFLKGKKKEEKNIDKTPFYYQTEEQFNDRNPHTKGKTSKFVPEKISDKYSTGIEDAKGNMIFLTDAGTLTFHEKGADWAKQKKIRAMDKTGQKLFKNTFGIDKLKGGGFAGGSDVSEPTQSGSDEEKHKWNSAKAEENEKKFLETMHKCNLCNGRGKVPAQSYGYAPQGGMTTCPLCWGKGEVLGKDYREYQKRGDSMFRSR